MSLFQHFNAMDNIQKLILAMPEMCDQIQKWQYVPGLEIIKQYSSLAQK